MSTRTIQYLLASVFLILGGWCLVSPSTVLDLAIRPEYQSDSPIVPILVAAFGAQAIIAGTFALFAKFTRATFAAYAIVLLPFFAFDYWFYAVEPMLTPIGLLDAVGNVVMLALCYLGWRSAATQPEVAQRRWGDGLKRMSVAGGIGLALLAADFTDIAPVPAFVGKAEARVGQPWTPASGAGVARRTTRRVIRRSTIFVATLPPACTRTSIEGVTVWRCGSTYYQPYRGRYVVVTVK
ncbi:hypothetical protein [Aminobacter sp. NyZ550]|uniref:hypothetical protein n=1 Tax=Aminobacter sp. NyZ550 TaxID=2979870 RepID=UPI003FA4D363